MFDCFSGLSGSTAYFHLALFEFFVLRGDFWIHICVGVMIKFSTKKTQAISLFAVFFRIICRI